MWKEPDPDPGGERTSIGQNSREISELKDQNEQQQLMIAQLKEMLRKEQSSVPQEKVEEYMNTLSKVKSKRARLKKDETGGREKSSGSSAIADSNKHERVNLLKQQLEENKAKLAERGLREKGIEEMVTILKAQLNDSQQFTHSTPVVLPSSDKNLEFNKNTSQEELYNILLVKEKKITDFMERTRKQEATILDLQENLKEKDSVIDARTKAITLMTDSLSKKSKESLDALDETREQMKKMQEDFVKLESEMKARQVKLLDDLKSKNLEIVELQEYNGQLIEEKNEYLKHNNDYEKREDDNDKNLIESLQHKLDQTILENNQNLEKILELEQKLKESSEEINRMKNSGASIEVVENSESEVVKLRKQLDESNKNMIKVRAQSKSKIKELTKKIDAFKKISDANALIVQLQNEITKLNEKIAELEEEKGNMQLKMVESTDSLKDENRPEENKEIQEKLLDYSKDLEEKDKIISLLESDIISLKEEINCLNKKISDFSHLENVQVTSEIKSIQFEEQLDHLETESRRLQNVIEELTSEKRDLMEKTEEITKEKQELNLKLDNYIQENIDLIDKLEKHSAEKVSSAESIEIVENLTQQEKLELAAYQKTVGQVHLEDSSKNLEDDNNDPPPELNESVLQLNEDSTELLNKIEMFNMERKEVMAKLEGLRHENSQLSLKLNEVENNRDILAETYEQLQNEKEELLKENEQLMETIKQSQSKNHHEVVAKETEEDSPTFIELQKLQSHYEKVLEKNENLKQTFDGMIHEKNNLETQLAESKAKIDELEINIKTSIEEINNYQTIIEENKVELINSANVINKLQNNLDRKEQDISELNILINDLNKVVGDLQKENEKLINFEVMDKQVDELKAALNEQTEVADSKEHENKGQLLHIKGLLNDLESKHADLTYQLFEKAQELEKTKGEIEKLSREQLEKDELLKYLEKQKLEEDNKIGGVIEEMKQKYLRLQQQLDGNSDSLEKKVVELSNKNKEQLEKMKKIAANLKKKTQAYLELEGKYKEEREKWETEVNRKESAVNDEVSSLQSQVASLEEEFKTKSIRLEESETQLKEFSDVIDNLEQQNAELQTSLLEMKHKYDKMNEVSLKQELSTSLHEEFDNLHGNNEATNEDKIKELELIIETNESELIHYKGRVQKLEQDISQLLEEKEILQKKASDLEEKLVLTSRTIEEKEQLGEELGNKLSEVRANDAELMRILSKSEEENRDLREKNKEREELIVKLKVKLKKAHEKVTQLKAAQSSMEELENINTELKKQLAHLESSVKHAHEEHDELQKKNQSDYERIESDYQAQMEELVTCRNELTVSCEKLQEALKNMQEREEELVSEVIEYRQKMEDLQNEHEMKIQQLTEELNTTTTNLNTTTSNLRVSLEEIETLKQHLTITQQQVIIQTAKEAVEDVVTKATEHIFAINSKETQTEVDETKYLHVDEGKVPQLVPTFQWTESQRPDGNIEEPYKDNTVGKQPIMEVTREDLVNKMNALEVLLYNVDKEKEEVLYQFSGMLNELTRLVFEKVNADPVIRKSSQASNNAPSSDLESQILSVDDIDATSDRKTLQQMEFEECSPSFGQQNVAIVEEVLQPKKAYLTYQAGAEAFGENDDGWGWGPEEAKLEEEHLHRAESTPQVQALRLEIAHLNERLQVFHVERENHLEEIKQLQVKSGKLIKKCKELKQKNDQLLSKKPDKSGNSDFFDLEQTIQDELKSQITSLEKKVKEMGTELDKERMEKNHILKRMDVLVSANEKMVEMKEIQDSEVLRWKRKYEEIEEKLQQYEWGSDGFSEGTKPKQVETDSSRNQNTEELQQIIKELSLDNEELQALLNEQRQLRVEAEKYKISGRSEEEFARITSEFEEEMKNLQQEIFNKDKEFHVGIEEKNKLLTELQGELKAKEEIINKFEENVKSLNEINVELKLALEEKVATAKQTQYSQFADQVQLLQASNAQLEALLAEKTGIADQLKVSCDEFVTMNDSLRNQIEYLTSELENLKRSYYDLQSTSSENILRLQNELNDKNLGQIKPEDTNPVVQQLTNNSANTLLELFEKYNIANGDFENLKVSYEKVVGDNKSITEKLSQVQQELVGLRKEFSEFQSSSSVNILGLQNELEEQKQKFDQLQTEKTFQINEMEKLLLEEQQKIKELQFEVDLRSAESSTLGQPSGDSVQKVDELESLLAAKEANIQELQNVVEDLYKQKAALEEEMKQLKNSLNEKQVELDNIVVEMEAKFASNVVELEQKWESQVDERGNTVAESWKYHLNMVESEFAAVQEKLKNEMNELEEKCNALVNENNELRKNVDTEIKNEVDRTSALQQQINESQKAIRELTEKLSQEQIAKVTFSEQLANLEYEKENLLKSLAEKEPELSSLRVIIETTQKQFDEKREVIEEIVKVLEKNTSWPLSCEKQDIVNELQRQLNVIHEKDEDMDRLREHISELQVRANTLKDKESEISGLNDLVNSLQAQLSQVQEKDQEIFRQSQTVEELQKHLSLLQERDDEIVQLNENIEEYKVKIGANQQELLMYRQEKNDLLTTLQSYKQQLEEYMSSSNTFQISLEEKNQQIQSLNYQLHQAESLKNGENKEREKLETEISQIKQEYYVLQQSLAECQQQLFQATQEVANKSYELDNVNQQLAYSQRNSEILEGELNKLRESWDTKQQEYTKSLEEVKKGRFTDMENHYEEILASKDIDIQTMRAQLNESVSSSQELNEKFTLEIKAKEELQKQLEEKINEQTTLIEEENNQLTEMRGIIEQQVIKIEQLKEELFEKSNEFDSLIAEMDIGRGAITQQPTTQSENPGTSSSSQRSVMPEEDLSEPVSRAELDLALYMLHQRDVRCEELMVELTHLLEERDTLQLRLSNAIREKEDLRRKLSGGTQAGALPSLSNPDPSTPISKSSAIFLAASGTELATEPSETPTSGQVLANKLSELKKVNYKRDKTLVDEQQLRRLQQMSIMEQHINEASKLPPEAQAKLVDASYTLSRDVQSPSKVLLNWLWGNSTPKMNDS